MRFIFKLIGWIGVAVLLYVAARIALDSVGAVGI